MKTREQEIQDLDNKLTEAKAALDAKFRILDEIGNLGNYAPPSVHYYKLYDKRGSVIFRIQRYASIAEGKSPDRELFARLLAQFPPVGKVMVKDGGCTSFRPASGDWKGELLDIHPITVQLELYQGQTAKFEWTADLAGELWEFEIEYHLSDTDLGSLDLRYSYHDRFHESVKRVEVCEFRPNHGAQRIRYASGSPTTPNPFVIWWDVDSGKAVNFPELVKVKA
jgi:hypothetical protein